MDTSYIKMCEKAAEVQNAWDPKDGDIFLGWASIDTRKPGEHPEILMVGQTLWSDSVTPMEGCSVWFPRQDQLQKMVFTEDELRKPFLLYQRVLLWCECKGPFWVCTSPEQFLLSYVMFEKHHKTWNGEDWIVS